MKWSAENLVPAERDPRKLRLTAFALVALMVISGVIIMIAYNRDAARRAEDDRPAFTSRLVGNFRVWRQDETDAGLLDLTGKVTVIVPVVFSQPETWAASRDTLKRLNQRYADGGEVTIVMLTLDPEEESPRELAKYAAELGAELPAWWLAAAREESVHKFVKNRLKANLYPYQAEGRWIYDPALVLMDRNGHLRKPTVRMRKPNGKVLNERLPVDLDFVEAVEFDKRGVPAGYEWSETGERTPLEKSNMEAMEELLFKSVDQLLAEPVGSPS